MIPKTIHYCWFGRGEMPALAKKCIESWKRFLPEYELRLWNEDSFDVNSHPFVKEAYEARKYAFVTDYVRLWAMDKEGGIYMDTDVEVLKPLDKFLHLPAFSGFETETAIPTGIMASEKGGEWVRTLLSYYDGKHFLKKDGTHDITTNVVIISEMMRVGGFRFDNTQQDYHGIVTMFPKHIFCPKSYQTGKISLTPETCTIHHFAGSWLGGKKKIVHWCRENIGHRFAVCVSIVLDGPRGLFSLLRKHLHKILP